MSVTSRLRLAVTVLALVAGAVGVRGYFIPEPVRTLPDGNIQVHEQLAWSGGTLLDGSTNLNVAFESALETWNQYLGRVRFVPVRASTAQIGDGNEVNNVFLSPTAFDEPFNENTLATTTSWYNTRTNRLTEFDIIVNDKWTWNSYRGPWRAGEKDIVRLGLRQLGVALGLGTPDRNGQTVEAIMNGTVGDLDTLTLDDIAGAAALYGSAPTASTSVSAVTDADGIATFALGASRQIPIQVRDPSTGSPIPGIQALMAPASDGASPIILHDPQGRYPPSFTEVQISSAAPAAAEWTTQARRPVAIEVPPPYSDTSQASAAWTHGQTTGATVPWDQLVQDYARLTSGVVLENRVATLEEIGNYSELLPWVAEVSATRIALTMLVRRNPAAAALLLGGFNQVRARAERRQIRELSAIATSIGARRWFECRGFERHQRFQLSVVRVMVPTRQPGGLQPLDVVLARALEEPLRPECFGSGTISGTVVDATKGQAVRNAKIQGLGRKPFLRFAGNGTFTEQNLPPDTYVLNVEAHGYEDGSSDALVNDGQTREVRIALQPLRVREVIARCSVSPCRIPMGGSATFTAVPLDIDRRQITPREPLRWFSERLSVATIDPTTGVARGISSGSSRINVWADGVTSDSLVLTVDPCPIRLSGSSASVPAAGGTVSVDATPTFACNWSARSLSSFVTITGGASGTGTATTRVTMNVAANTGADRVGSVLIGEEPFTITQGGTCTYTLSRSNIPNVAASATGGLTVDVVTTPGCPWTVVVPTGSFVSASPTSGSGPRTVTLSVTANTGGPRSTTLTIAGRPVTVSQLGGSTSGTTMTGAIQCTRGTTGGGIFNSLTCTGNVSLTIGPGFTSGNSYIGIFSENSLSLRTSAFTAAAAGSRYDLTVRGNGSTLDPDRPPCPPTQTLVGFYRVNEIVGNALVSARVAIPVTCN